MNQPTTEQIENLLKTRNQVRDLVINRRKELIQTEQIFFKARSRYEKAVQEYTALDKEYALALMKLKQKKVPSKTKPYNAAKRTAEKAMKQLASLPKELREKIIADFKDGVF